MAGIAGRSIMEGRVPHSRLPPWRMRSSSRDSLPAPGTIVVTGRPKPSTRRIRSRRSHFDTRLGSVEIVDLIEVALPHRVPDRLERVGTANQSFDFSSRGLLHQPERTLQRPVRRLALSHVRNEQSELARTVVGAAPNRLH